jgi:hypothetical protein
VLAGRLANAGDREREQVTPVTVTESYLPAGGSAVEALDELRRLQAANSDPNTIYGGIIETRRIGERAPRTTAAWCVVVRRAAQE